MAKAIHISDLPSVSEVTGNLRVVMDTEDGLKKTTLDNLKTYIRTLNNQDKTITENGTYTADEGYDGLGEVTVNVEGHGNLQENKNIYVNGEYEADLQPVNKVGLRWYEDPAEYYTGDKTIIGTAFWFNTDSFYNLKPGDLAYNGKYNEDENIVPNFEESLGTITNITKIKTYMTTLVSDIQYQIQGEPTNTVDGVKYYKVGLDDWAIEHSSVTIVGNYIWIAANSFEDFQNMCLIYNSTDSTDTAPDITKNIGTISNVAEALVFYFDFTGLDFRDTLYSVQYVEYLKVYDGMCKVTVSVPTYETEVQNFIQTTLSGWYSVPNGITYIGNSAFRQQSQLTGIELNEVTSINNYSFQDCTNLKVVNPSYGIYALGNSAFSNCTSLLTFDCTNLYAINSSTFYNCASLNNIDLSNTSYVYGYAFYNCINLSNITFPSTRGFYIYDYGFYGCTGLEEINLKNVISMARYCFANCTNLKHVTFGTSLYNIQSTAFMNCTQDDLVIEFTTTESETKQQLGNYYNYLPWGATNATIVYADSYPHSFKINVLNKDIGETVILQCNGKTIHNNSTIQAKGTEITYTVSARNYITQTNTITLNEDTTLNITLEADPNPVYYEIDPELIFFDSNDISIEENAYGDKSILKVVNPDTNKVANCWGCMNTYLADYASSFGNPSAENFQQLADEFTLSFKVNIDLSLYPSYYVEGVLLAYLTGMDGFYIKMSSGEYYSYLRTGTNDISEDWHSNTPANNLINVYNRISVKRENDTWVYRFNNSNTWTNASNGSTNLSNVLDRFFASIYISNATGSSIEIDFAETGFKKNGVWVQRYAKNRVARSDLTINCNVNYAELTVNDRRRNLNSPVSLPTGSSVTYKLTARNYITYEQTITLNEDTNLNITLEADPNPIYYEIDPNSIVITPSVNSCFTLEENMFTDICYLKATDYVSGENVLITDDEWTTYFRNLTDSSLNNFMELADEFVLTFRLEQPAPSPTFDSYVYLLNDSNLTTTGLYIVYEPDSYNDMRMSFREGANYRTTYWFNVDRNNMFNRTYTYSMLTKSANYYTHTLTYDNTSDERSFTGNYGGFVLDSILGISNGTVFPKYITIDFENTGFKKNGVWVKRLLTIKKERVDFVINATPANATILVNNKPYTNGSVLHLPKNEDVTYNVSYRNKITQSDTVTLTQATTLNITLEDDPNPVYYGINTNILASVGNTYTVSTNSDGDKYETTFEGFNYNDKMMIMDDDYNRYFSSISNNKDSNYLNLADEFKITFKLNSTIDFDSRKSTYQFYILNSDICDFESASVILDFTDAKREGKDTVCLMLIYNNWPYCNLYIPYYKIINNVCSFSLKAINSTTYFISFTANDTTYTTYAYVNANWPNDKTLPIFENLFKSENTKDSTHWSPDSVTIYWNDTGFKKNGVWVKKFITQIFNSIPIHLTATPSNSQFIIDNKLYPVNNVYLSRPQNSTFTYKAFADGYFSQTVTENFGTESDYSNSLTLTQNTQLYEIDTTKINIVDNTSTAHTVTDDSDGNSVLCTFNDPSGSIWNSALQTRTMNHDIKLIDDAQSLLNSVLTDGAIADEFQMQYKSKDMHLSYNVDGTSDLYQMGLIGRTKGVADQEVPLEHNDWFELLYSKHRTDGEVTSNNMIVRSYGNYYDSTSEYHNQMITVASGNTTNFSQDDPMTNVTFKIVNNKYNDKKIFALKTNYTGRICDNILLLGFKQLDSQYEQNIVIEPYLLSNVGSNHFGSDVVELDLKNTGFKKNGEWVWRPIKAKQS